MNSNDAMLFESYRNNDVFLKLENSHRTRLYRLTKEPAYASEVHVRFAGGRALVAWSGYSRVGKSMSAFGAKPEIFLASIPIDSWK